MLPTRSTGCTLAVQQRRKAAAFVQPANRARHVTLCIAPCTDCAHAPAHKKHATETTETTNVLPQQIRTLFYWIFNGSPNGISVVCSSSLHTARPMARVTVPRRQQQQQTTITTTAQEWEKKNRTNRIKATTIVTTRRALNSNAPGPVSRWTTFHRE